MFPKSISSFIYNKNFICFCIFIYFIYHMQYSFLFLEGFESGSNLIPRLLLLQSGVKVRVTIRINGSCLCRVRLYIFSNVVHPEHDTNNNHVKNTYSNTTHYLIR